MKRIRQRSVITPAKLFVETVVDILPGVCTVYFRPVVITFSKGELFNQYTTCVKVSPFITGQFNTLVRTVHILDISVQNTGKILLFFFDVFYCCYACVGKGHVVGLDLLLVFLCSVLPILTVFA